MQTKTYTLTGASGTQSLSEFGVYRQRSIVIKTVSGTANVHLKGGVSSDRLAVLHTQAGLTTTPVAWTGDNGPWTALQLAWDAAAADITVDVQFWTEHPL